MASIQETDAGGFRVSVCKMGVRDTRTFPPGTPRSVARNWGTTREAEIIAGINVAKTEDHTVRHLIEQFMRGPLLKRVGAVWEEGRCKWFLRNLSFLDVQLRALELEEVEEWICERHLEVSGESIRRDLTLLGPIFKWGITRKKWLENNPIHLADWPPRNDARDMRITNAHADAMIAALGYVRGTVPLTKSERLAVAFLLALETGMRRGELLKTTWEHVHARHIHLPAAITKNRKKRDVPLTPEASRLVRLLPREDGGHILGNLDADSADAMFRKARVVARLPRLHFHDTRHEAVSRLALKLEILPLSKMIGHEDLNSLKRYYNPTVEEIGDRLI
jgi:site-specific recombinase XerD